MTGTFNDVVHCSCPRIRGRKLGIPKPCWLVLKDESSSGPCRLEILKSEDSLEPPKKLEMADVSSISISSSKDNEIVIESKDRLLQILLDSESCCREWLKALEKRHRTGIQRGVLGAGMVMSRMHDRSIRQTSLATFHVNLLPCTNLSQSGECILQLSSSGITLCDVNDQSMIFANWAFSTLRKYGRNSTSFYIESGRKSSTGEGMYVFNTTQGEQIYTKVRSATLAMESAVRISRTSQEDQEQQKRRLGSDSSV